MGEQYCIVCYPLPDFFSVLISCFFAVVFVPDSGHLFFSKLILSNSDSVIPGQCFSLVFFSPRMTT